MRMRFGVTALLAAAFATTGVVSQDSAGVDLGGGLVTRTDVKYLADLALDIRDIKQYLGTADGAAVATSIYNDGRNAETVPGLRFKLKGLPDKMSENGVVKATPGYLFHLYGLADRSRDIADLNEFTHYSDEYIRSAISSARDDAATAILVLGMWMYGTHLLYNGVDTCHKLINADNPQLFDLKGGGVEEFIALWIGTGQKSSSSDGNSLYALAQFAGEQFDTADPEADVNTKIKLLYQEGANILSLPGACSAERPDSAKQLWSVAQRIMTQMNIPMIQMLILSIIERDVLATEVFAMAIIPQVAQCRPSTFKRLKEELLSGPANFDKTDQILEELQKIYDCLGFTCEDIGYYESEAIDMTCSEGHKDLAEYSPTTDVSALAKMDLDILQLRILTSLQSYEFARYWYEYGRNAPIVLEGQTTNEYYNLFSFATSTSRRDADPLYTDFEKYHNDPNYADKIVQSDLGKNSKWGTSALQRSAAIAETCAFQVLYMHLAAEINGAVKECRSDAEVEYGMAHPWDEVAAFLIGSLEGEDEGGSLDPQDGQLAWGLANKRAFQFQTLRSGYAEVNSEFEDLLFAGKGELDAKDCDNLELTANRIKNLMLVPLLQSVLRYAIQNELHGVGSDNEDLAMGEAFALAVIPIMKVADPGSADIVEQNMIVREGVPLVRDGAQTVADALGSFAVEIGIGCESIGDTPQADPCLLTGRSSANSLRPLAIALTTVVGVFFLF